MCEIINKFESYVTTIVSSAVGFATASKTDREVSVFLRCEKWCGNIAQLIERRTGTPLMRVRYPGAARDFLPESTFSVDSLTVSVRPRVQLHVFTSVCTLKIP